MSSFNLLLIFVSLLSWLSIRLLKPFLISFCPDLAGERSLHKGVIPRGAGIGFILSSFIGILIYSQLSFEFLTTSTTAYILLILIPLIVGGLIDDLYGLSVKSKFSFQIVSALILTYTIISSETVRHSELSLLLFLFLCSFAFFTFLTIVNFYNFMDGLDGLVASTSFIQLIFLGLYFNFPILLIVAASTLGFIFWNWAPAKVFMGDVGSLFLGGVIATSIAFAPNFNFNFNNALVGLAVTLPLTLDATYCLILRFLRGENIFKAHRSHLYQRLHLHGLAKNKVTLLYSILNILSAILLYFYSFSAVFGVLLLNICFVLLVEIYLKKSLNIKIIDSTNSGN